MVVLQEFCKLYVLVGCRFSIFPDVLNAPRDRQRPCLLAFQDEDSRLALYSRRQTLNQKFLRGQALFFAVSIYFAYFSLGAGGKPSLQGLIDISNSYIYVIYTISGFSTSSILDHICLKITMTIAVL